MQFCVLHKFNKALVDPRGGCQWAPPKVHSFILTYKFFSEHSHIRNWCTTTPPPTTHEVGALCRKSWIRHCKDRLTGSSAQEIKDIFTTQPKICTIEKSEGIYWRQNTRLGIALSLIKSNSSINGICWILNLLDFYELLGYRVAKRLCC